MKKLLIIFILFILFHSFVYSNTKSIDKQDKEKIHKEIKAVLEKAFLLSTTQAKSNALKTYLLKHLPKNMSWNDNYLARKVYVDNKISIGKNVYKRLQSSKIKITKETCTYIDNASIDCRVETDEFKAERYEDSPQLLRSQGIWGYLINFQLDDKAQWYIHGFRIYDFPTPEETSIALEKKDLQKRLAPSVTFEFMDTEIKLDDINISQEKAPKKIYMYKHSPEASIERDENFSSPSEKDPAYRYYQPYYPSRARNYALRYALNYNRKYIRYKYDCTNFISQALYAGGWRYDLGWYTRNDVWWYSSYYRFYTWGGAANLTSYLFYQRDRANVEREDSIFNLRIGDIIAISYNHHDINHMMMVTATNPTLLSAHTHDRRNVSLSVVFPDGHFSGILFHIRRGNLN